MKPYKVVWKKIAANELTEAWMASANRAAVTSATHWLEERLAQVPLYIGDSRGSSVHRVIFRAPIGIEYEVVEDDKLVIVRGVFRSE